MGHMAEIAQEAENGVKLTHHRCFNGVKRWICTSCFRQARKTRLVRHKVGCKNRTERNQHVQSCQAH